MKSRITEEFRELFAALPEAVRRQARAAFRKFNRNPAHPSLSFKRVCNDPSALSARVGKKSRALAYVEKDVAAWFWIGSHAEYDQILKRL